MAPPSAAKHHASHSPGWNVGEHRPDRFHAGHPSRSFASRLVVYVKRPARPRDPNQLAKLILDITTGERQNDSPRPGQDAPAMESRRKGGLKGGKARARKLSARQRRNIAKKAARARWAKT